MKQQKCPFLDNGGLFFSEKVLRLTHLSQLQQAMLAYVENCDGPCNASYEHLAQIMRCSKLRIRNAMDTLAACGFFNLEPEVLKHGIQINHDTTAWNV